MDHVVYASYGFKYGVIFLWIVSISGFIKRLQPDCEQPQQSQGLQFGSVC